MFDVCLVVEFFQLCVVFQDYFVGVGYGMVVDYYVIVDQQFGVVVGLGLVEVYQVFGGGLCGIGYVFFYGGFGEVIGNG